MIGEEVLVESITVCECGVFFGDDDEVKSALQC